MTPAISSDTQAILLLTAPLITGQAARDDGELLTPGEYRRVARQLKELGRTPSDLLGADAGQLTRELSAVVSTERIQRLLERGFLVSQAVERWRSRAIWIVSRADAEYPQKFKARLKDDAPAVLYGCGPRSLLELGGLAVVGSRHADPTLLEYAQGLGQQAATAKKTVISGGAPGIDRAAMTGALEAGGRAIGVMADSLERAVLQRENRNWLLDEQLVLISPYDPGAGFNVGHAMQRNKLIYALSDAAVVVSSDYEKGGTWAGATEQLQKLKFVPVYVRSTGEIERGLQDLGRMGARPWPNPEEQDEFLSILNTTWEPISEQQAELSFQVAAEPMDQDTSIRLRAGSLGTHQCREENSGYYEESNGYIAVKNEAVTALEPAELLFARVREILTEILVTPRKESEVASMLQVSGAQMKTWLHRLVQEGVLERRAKPARFVLKQKNLT
ncbi:MAG TPA: DNA-processing protein DprA [Terriglobales bacterium]|nr:DNA-processing protein DprA [Terriglobales bacterium]